MASDRENDTLRREVAELRGRLAAERAGKDADRQSRRAALNLIEDAIAARREAEDANHSKDDFLAIVGHELRTPLTAITLWTRALRDVDQREDAIAAIEQSAECQARLIDDLLDLARLGSGKLSLVRYVVDVRGVIARAVDAMKPLAKVKRIELTSTLQPLGSVLLDGMRLTQVVWNLLNNALKFTPEGGHVHIDAAVREGRLEIEVADDGQGIAPELLPRVFDMFRRTDVGMRREHTGLGIGLMLAKELVELHGGTIEARSDGVGRGAVFRVSLPWIAAERDEPATYDARTLGDVRVLLVEDDAGTRDAMRWTLEHAGAKVASFSNASDALGHVSQVDVLVSDVALPGMSGIELVARLAESCRERGTRPLPSCAISAHTRETDRQGAIDAGFDIFLAKPVMPERLIEAVADLRAML